ncbi:MAG: hypothetical protein WCA59_05605 [Candidatus Binataceae bacterium]
MATRDKGNSLTLIMTGEIDLAQMVEAGNSFARMLREVERAVTGKQRESVKWIVSAARTKSLELRVEGRLVNVRESPATVRTTVRQVVSGIKAISSRAKRPAHFSDIALEETRALANLASISLKNGRAPIPLDRKVAEHVDQLIAPRLTSVGTVVGTLEGLTIHGRRVFVIYEQLTGQRVECSFGPQFLDQALRGFGKRVSVYGRVRSRLTGEKVAIDVEEFEIFPPESELPSAEEVRGILNSEN